MVQNYCSCIDSCLSSDKTILVYFSCLMLLEHCLNDCMITLYVIQLESSFLLTTIYKSLPQQLVC
uniref:Putative ovule protein n=1 Tax=Solanum chacoense TaxID=4108 RepID=A0A0V0I3H9_SOLCH